MREIYYNSDITPKAINEIKLLALYYDKINIVNDLEVKMKNLKSKTFRKFIEKMQNPKSYVPLIGTVVASMPMEYALLGPLGLITEQSYLEYQEEKGEITNNGLYFLLKLKN